MYQWRKDTVSWTINKTLYLSIPFTWLLPQAKDAARKHKGTVVCGGPAVMLMPDYMADVAEIHETCNIPVLQMHNPLATFTTRGCVNKCGFCAVPKVEGDFRELIDWEVKPVVCDNNILASSRRHFDAVIDKLKVLPMVDFNQGLDCRLFDNYHASRIAELQYCKMRFAFDHSNVETQVHDAIERARTHGLKDISVYVLIGFNDSPDDARYRLEKVREWGMLPNPMRYQPLDSLVKNSYVGNNWTDNELKRMSRYYSRLNYLGHIPYNEYKEREYPLFENI